MTLLLVNSAIIIAFLIFLALQGSAKPIDWVASIKERLLQMMAASKDKRLFSSFISSPIGWIRNASSWVSGYNFTGTAAGITRLGGVGGGTLITPRHVLFANHVPYPEQRPFDIFFVNATNKTFAYKVTEIRQVGTTDIAIGFLDRDVDSSLKIYPILPDNWGQYIDSRHETYDTMGVRGIKIAMVMPILYCNQDKLISTADVTEVYMGIANVTPPEFDPAREFTTPLAIGDSGNPIFVQAGNELVLLGAWYKGQSGALVGSFPWIHQHREQIEAVTGIKLRTAQFTGFKKLA